MEKELWQKRKYMILTFFNQGEADVRCGRDDLYVCYRIYLLPPYRFSVLLSFLGLYYLKMKKAVGKKQKQELNVQFKDLLYFLSTSLSAGRSLENAFESSLESLQRLYGHEESHIVAEVMIILGRLNMGDTVEECLIDFSKRARIEDISNFTDVLVTCKRKGGNVNEVIRMHRES